MVDPLGRRVNLAYDSANRLQSITDAIGMQTTFTYDGGTFVTSMTTPYGTTQYASGQIGYHWWLTTTDPLGNSDRQEYLHAAPGIPYSESQVPANTNTFNAYMNYRNSYYWDKAVVKLMGSNIDYTKARIKHWEHKYNDFTYATPAPIVESTKEPLENRVWHYYAGQPNSVMAGPSAQPSMIARVLDNGSTQAVRMTYNTVGNVLTQIDPAGRTTAYDYAPNGIDVLKVRQIAGAQQEVLAQYTYNSLHLPLTYTDAAGKTTQYVYNTAGQITSKTNAKGETTTYQYNNAGYLLSETNPLGKIQRSYTYDGIGRIASMTDSEGYTLSYQYDALNRKVSTTYPDGTTSKLVWDKLDVVSETNRLGQTTQYSYDAARNRISETDPLGNVTHFTYYANGLLQSLTDANGHTTVWNRDIEGRVTSKSYPKGGTYRGSAGIRVKFRKIRTK